MSKHEKTAIVTGASGGLGTAIAKALVDHDYNVVLTGTNAERLAAAEAAIGSEAVLSVVADVGAAADRRLDEATLDRFLSINLKGTYFLTQAVIPHLQAAGGGAVINVGTVLVDHALGGVPASAAVASKGAIHALTVQLAAEFGKDKIRVNTIAPGIVRTPIHTRNGIEDADSLAGLHLVNRIGEPEEIASVAVQLAENGFISGATINVDGGHVAGHHLG
jgi:NAD(P)-dependent dehydrogenase (short-subunit alcohol dehydrogenase family)